MRTDDLVDLLSTGVAPVKRGAASRRFALAVPLAYLGGLLLMLAVYGLRPDLAAVARTALFWEKLAFPSCVAIGALIATTRLARPGARVGAGWPIMALAPIAVWIAAILLAATVTPEARMRMMLGHTWHSCPFNIVLLSIPGFVAIFWAVRGLAPTRLRLAGAVSGLLASSLGTMAYCLHCPEMSPAFWGIWYLLGMLLPAMIGALLGPRLLRW